MAEQDAELMKLAGEKMALDARIAARQKEIAIAEGRVVKSLDDLKCEHHSNAKFEISGEIPGSFLGMPGRTEAGLNTYVCVECKTEEEKGLHPTTEAYDCPRCGIVKGTTPKRHYNDIGQAPLCGSEGNKYLCGACGLQLGEHAFRHS